MEVGSAALTDVLEVQLRILELEQQQKQLLNARREPQAQINQILNRPSSQPVMLQVVPALAEMPWNLDSLNRRIRQTYPGFAALRYEQETSRLRQAVNRLDRKPGLAIGLDYAVMPKGEGIHAGDGKDMWMPRLGLRLPLLREPYDAKEKEEAVQTTLDYQAEELANAFAASVEQALTRLEDARLRYDSPPSKSLLWKRPSGPWRPHSARIGPLCRTCWRIMKSGWPLPSWKSRPFPPASNPWRRSNGG